MGRKKMNVNEKIKILIRERNELENDLEFINSQEQKDFIEEQIFDINHSIKTLQTYGKLEIRPN
jgi:uncharacterized protein (UPF0305 family)